MLAAVSSPRKNLLRLLLAVLIGALFFLPHAVRMATLHTVSGYSPFSALSPSPTTIDETYLYGAEVNYSYRQHRLANDTDAFEHRDEPMPYSVLPAEAEVLLAEIFRSVGAAQVFCHFLFPAITAWLLMGLFLELDASIMLAAFLALVTLVASFSLRTIEIGTRSLLLHGLHSGFIETLQASRNPNPNMTFLLFLGALLAQAAALYRRSTAYALLAGALGGLLFYSYIYYAISWAGAAALLVVLALPAGRRDYFKLSSVALLTTICAAVPFLLWVRAAKKAGGYFYRSNRLGMVHSHIPAIHDLKLSAVFVVCLVLLWLGWWRYFVSRQAANGGDLRFASVVVMVFGCAVAGGILGMNMQILTGFNVQAGHHFPHMVIQPALILLCLIMLLVMTETVRRQRSGLWAGVLFAALFFVCTASQVEAGINSAPLHRVTTWEQVLFDWLNHNTHPGDVVATTSLQLALYMPVYSQDCTLMVNGSRTSASDSEILNRYLLAEALIGAPADTIANDLGSNAALSLSHGHPWASYPAFFYEYSSYLADRTTLTREVIEASLARYRSLSPADGLRHFRVDYLYSMNGQTPVLIDGFDWQKVLVTTNGTLWRLHRQ
jgi:hypothetical protein